MDWTDWAVWVAIVALGVAAALLLRLFRQNRRLRHLAAESERLRLQTEATEQRNRQLKQEMTSNIAHELKTPVSSIRGYLEILLGEHPVDDERKRYYLERCYRQTLRLSDLVHDVSLINKAEESADLFPRRHEDVRAVAEEAVGELREKADAAGITVADNLPQPMPLMGNHELLYCIFRNLIENSVAYAGSGASVTIETYKESPTHYYIHFYDTGAGVADEYLSKLFDRFLRIDEGRSRRRGGTGLGLSIVKHAVMFHGGEIYARNREGGGLEFFFSLKR